MEYPAFVGPSYESQALTADQEDLINMYIERLESPGANAETALYPTPGVTQLSQAASGPGRAHFFMDGREFAVIGTTLWEISSVGAMTNRGTVAIGANPATISSNGAGGGQLFITSGDNGYVFTLATNTLAAIGFLAGKATMGDHLDGYFLALDANTSTLYLSNLLDGSTWDPTQFAQRSIAPDPWISMKVLGRYIWLFGTQTSEVWFDAGTAPFPFKPHPSGLLSYGIAAKFGAVVAEGSLLWLGSSAIGNGQVLRTSGFAPETISTYPLANALNSYSTIADAIGDTYNDQGHTFYILTFPTANITWAWDSQTRTWAKRGTWISEDNHFVEWRPRHHAFAFNEHRVLDSETGSLYKLNNAVGATDVDSRPIRRLRRAPAIESENERIYYSQFELDMEVGTAPATGAAQDIDPTVMLRFSNDGGKNWSPEIGRSGGKAGEYSTRVIWNKLGNGRRRVFEVAWSSAVPWRITNAFLKLGQPPPAFRQQRNG